MEKTGEKDRRSDLGKPVKARESPWKLQPASTSTSTWSSSVLGSHRFLRAPYGSVIHGAPFKVLPHPEGGKHKLQNYKTEGNQQMSQSRYKLRNLGRKSGNRPVSTLHATSMARCWTCRRSNRRMNTHVRSWDAQNTNVQEGKWRACLTPPKDITVGFRWFFKFCAYLQSHLHHCESSATASTMPVRTLLRAGPTNKSSSFSDHSNASLGKFNLPKLNMRRKDHRCLRFSVRIKKGGYPLAIKHGWQMAMVNHQFME